MAKVEYDVVIIGGGQAGIPLAWALAGKGRSVALVERSNLGGSCVNFGCTPTKAAIASAKLAHSARRAREFGIDIPAVNVDFPAVLARAREVLMHSRSGLDAGFQNSVNPELIRAHARLAGRSGDSFRIDADGRELLGKEAVLNSGTRTLVPPIDGLSDIDFLHSGNWLHRPKLPSHIAMIGGGYIALEMAQFYRRMGSAVTVLEKSGQVLAREDVDIASSMQSFLEREGIRILLNTTIDSIAPQSAGLLFHLDQKGRKLTESCSHVFVATGRKPNTDDLGLTTVGLETDAHGFVKADERLASKVKGIWVAGDIRGGPQFTHTSWDDYRILLSQMTGNGSRTTERIVPYAVFTDPELGRVGVSEKEARRSGKRFKVARFDFNRNGKANEIGEPDGFIKVVVEEGTDQILGAAVLGAHASELVHLYIDVMNAHAPYTVIRDAVHIHPTLAEAIQSAVSAP
jgi:pyruvate/2-oxoglutarate dehydrogenase complex dihydrolipoamide dehydrogenase (E3) component